MRDSDRQKSFWNSEFSKVLAGVTGTAVLGAGAFLAKPETSASDLLNELDKSNMQTGHEVEMLEVKHKNDMESIKMRQVQQERFEIRVQNELTEQKNDMLMMQQQAIETLEEVKELREQ